LERASQPRHKPFRFLKKSEKAKGAGGRKGFLALGRPRRHTRAAPRNSRAPLAARHNEARALADRRGGKKGRRRRCCCCWLLPPQRGRRRAAVLLVVRV